MAFQLKNFTSIVASMINHVRGTSGGRLTDFNIGSVTRTMLEAPAIEIDELYQQFFNGVKEAIPVAVFNSFNFARQTAVPASGLVRVSVTPSASAIVISAGTAFSTAASSSPYVSAVDVVVPPGQSTADVLAIRSGAGVAGNLAANSIFKASPAPSGFVSATNLAAFTNGADVETDDQRKRRFQDFVSTLARGTVEAVDYGARTASIRDANGLQSERVRAVAVIEPYLTDNTVNPALVNVHVHNGVGSTSGALVAEVAKVLHGYVAANGVKVSGWKAAGSKVTVAAAAEVALNMTATMVAADGYTASPLISAARKRLAEYVLGLDLGKSFIFAEAVHRVMGVEGMKNFVFTAPLADVPVTAAQKLMPGVISINGFTA